MDENLRRVFDQTRPSPEQKESMLSRLLEPEKEEQPVKHVKRMVIFGLAAALMVITCAAAVVTGIDRRLLDYFGAGPEQAELLVPGAMPVDITAEDNGAAFHVSQVLMDRYNLMMLAEFTAPEGVALDNEGDPFAMFGDFELHFLNQAGEPYSEDGLTDWAFTINCLEDEDPLDNHMTVLLDLRLNKDVDCQDTAFLRLSFTDFGWFNQDILEFVSLCSGTWSCDIPLPQRDMGQSYEGNIPVGQTDGITIFLKNVYLSPMTLQITLEREIPIDFFQDEEEVRHRWQGVLDGTERISLTDRDGRTIPLQGRGGGAGFQQQEHLYRLTEITDLEQFQGGSLTLKIGDGSVKIPLDNLVPAGS